MHSCAGLLILRRRPRAAGLVNWGKDSTAWRLKDARGNAERAAKVLAAGRHLSHGSRPAFPGSSRPRRLEHQRDRHRAAGQGGGLKSSAEVIAGGPDRGRALALRRGPRASN